MNTTLIIVADLGLLRAYRQTQNEADRQAHLELIEEMQLASAYQKLSDQLTDQAGRFPRGGGAGNISGDLSAGESLNSEAEQSRRLISQLAGRINTLLAEDEVTRCSLAVSGAIHKQLLEALDPRARAKIVQSLASNLTKTDPQALAGHFARAAA